MSLLPKTIDDRVRMRLAPAQGGARGVLTSSLRFLYVLADAFFDEQISQMAAGLVYTTLLSLVPLLAVGFSVLKAFGVSTKLEIMLYYFLEPLGERGADISMAVISFVEHMNVAVLGAIGLVTLLYSVVSTISKMESALNSIWHVKETRPLSLRFSAYLSIVLAGPVLVFTAISLIVSLKSSYVAGWLLSFPGIGVAAYWAGKVLPYLFAALCFTLIYVFLPHTRVGLRPALTGGCYAAVAWGIMGWAFASFVATSSRYSAIYSGFAGLFLFLIWVYWNWTVLLAGAKVAFVIDHPGYFRKEEGTEPGERFRERVAFRILLLIGRAYYSGGKPLNAASLSSELGMPIVFLQDLIKALAERGMLIPTAGEPPAYVFAKDPDAISLYEVITSVRKGHEEESLPCESRGPEPAVDAVMKEIDEAIASGFGARSLKDLIDSSRKTGKGEL